MVGLQGLVLQLEQLLPARSSSSSKHNTGMTQSTHCLRRIPSGVVHRLRCALKLIPTQGWHWRGRRRVVERPNPAQAATLVPRGAQAEHGLHWQGGCYQTPAEPEAVREGMQGQLTGCGAYPPAWHTGCVAVAPRELPASQPWHECAPAAGGTALSQASPHMHGHPWETRDWE